MGKIINKIISMAVASAMILSPTVAFSETNNTGLKEKADAMATALVSTYGETSIQYALMDNGKIILSGNKGVYDKKSNKAITKDTMYGIGSVSKMFVSAATMMLVDWGKVDIDKPVVTYIPQFKMADKRYQQITPRMLLNHSSGLYGSTFRNTFLFNDNDTSAHDKFLSELKNQKLKSNPGEFSVYCNDGFTLLEILVEKVSGMTYTEFLNKYINKPLNLENTKTPLDNFDKAKLAKTYIGNDSALPIDSLNAIGAGGVYSTAEDLCKFSEVLMGKKSGILSEKSVQAMQSEEYKKGIWVSEDKNYIGYGLGWDSVNLGTFSDYNIKSLWKGGDTILYHASIINIPEYNISMAVLSSGGSSLFNSLFSSTILQQLLKEKGIIKEIKENNGFGAPVKAKMPDDMKKYLGLYGCRDRVVEIDIKNEELVLPEAMVGPGQKFIYIGNGEFKNNLGNIVASFQEEKNGVTYLKFKQFINLLGIGTAEMADYQLQKLETNSLNKDVLNTWKKRNGKRYLTINEKATSQVYLMGIGSSELKVDMKNGYVNGNKIIDSNNAISVVQIPGMGGRDVMDYTFYKENNIEYAKSLNTILISEDNVAPISTLKGSVAKIEKNGYAKWYKIDKKYKNKTITVKLPKKGAFAVYDAKGTYMNFTTVSGKNSYKLPENGFIVFVGGVGDTFKFTLK